MKILWITNLLMSEAYHILTKKERRGSGGWLEASANALVKTGEVSLSVVAASPLVSELVVLQGEAVTYYVFPFKKDYTAGPYEPFMAKLQDELNPDIVHVHGTEYPYGLAYMKVAGAERVVVSMQGIMTSIAEHYMEGLTNWQVLANITLRDLRLKTIFGEQREFKERSSVEQETIRKARYVIGRTSFDKNFVLSVHPECEYFHCNESLRESFYHHKWRYSTCTPHSIFLSQSNYPVKGLHQFLKALPQIKRKYPDVQVRIAGEDITSHRSGADIMRYSGYGSIVFHLMKQLSIRDCVRFTGLLNESEMTMEYLNANVFVCPSTCENSSNSIAEAQILGVPCIASARGGNPDMIPEKTFGTLYDFDSVKELADAIIGIFEESPSFDGTPSRQMALERHDKKRNLERTLEIYKTIYGTE